MADKTETGTEFNREVPSRTSGVPGTSDLNLDDPVTNVPDSIPFEDTISTTEGLREPTDSIEIGGDNDCDCNVPELEVDKGEVGPWRFQVVSCSACKYRFGAAVEHAEEDEDDE